MFSGHTHTHTYIYMFPINILVCVSYRSHLLTTLAGIDYTGTFIEERSRGRLKSSVSIYGESYCIGTAGYLVIQFRITQSNRPTLTRYRPIYDW